VSQLPLFDIISVKIKSYGCVVPCCDELPAEITLSRGSGHSLFPFHEKDIISTDTYMFGDVETLPQSPSKIA
jgi:hypothetical protein